MNFVFRSRKYPTGPKSEIFFSQKRKLNFNYVTALLSVNRKFTEQCGLSGNYIFSSVNVMVQTDVEGTFPAQRINNVFFHRLVQDVDCVHNSIEHTLRKSDNFSPVSLSKQLDTKKSSTMIQIQEKYFLSIISQ